MFVLGSGCVGGAAWADASAGLADFRSGEFSQAVQAWRDAADRGDATAALYLGVLYDTGIGVPQDYVQALAWYERGAEGGSATAALNAAVMHDAGRGTAPDPAAALRWYERAAARGSGRAEYDLALIYQTGSGVPVDHARALRYFRAAAAHGIGAARMHLAALGSPHASAAPRPDPADPAMVSFERAQNVLLERGVGEAAQAFKFFEAAAEAGNPLAAYNLAYYYEHGIGVQRSTTEAVKWYRRSEEGATDRAIKELAVAGLRHLRADVANAQR